MKIINENMKINHWKNIVSNDCLRPVMTGVYFDLINKVMVGTNAHLLLECPLEIEFSEEELELTKSELDLLLKKHSKIVPLELFDTRKYMGDPKYYAFPIHYDFSYENFAHVYNGPELVFRCKYIDGVFLNYRAVYPQNVNLNLSKVGINMPFFNMVYKSIPFSDKSLIFEFFGAFRFTNLRPFKPVFLERLKSSINLS